MFIGGVAIAEEKLHRLENLGLKDSKKLTDERRKELGPVIAEHAAETTVKEITASEIDELRAIMSLNAIEIRGFARVIEDLEPDAVIIDLPEPNAETFGKKLQAAVDETVGTIDITAEHEADDTYPIVSGASILAKNAREAHVNELHEKYDRDFASGYPHDTPTIEFLEDYCEKHGHLPPETRTSWSTAQRIKEQHEQASIDSF
ncbi:MAG: ribonuclease HII [Candidatus Nanohaloarchaeota archaeon QJJ-5]|nr:ribonuclease HII [Candidatus Nanohaloarchaeota archaeon QJJ-5]